MRKSPRFLSSTRLIRIISFLYSRSVREASFYNNRGSDRQFFQNSNPEDIRKHVRPQSWYGAQITERKSKERPQSIHEISLDRSKQNSSFNHGHDYRIPPYDGHSSRSELKSARFRDRRNRQFESSRSLSSSYSSQVGSSADEREADHHGVYSAYDMTQRSPYGSLVLRRYSQSSLSSSSASWQQSTNSLSHHAVRGQWGSGSLGSSSPDKFHGHREHQRQTTHKAVFLKTSPKISEHVSSTNATFISAVPADHFSGHRIRVNAQPHRSHNPRVYAQATPYSSSQHITTPSPARSQRSHSVTHSSDNVTQVFPSVTQVSVTHEQEDKQLSPSVKDLAKRFSGEFFSESFEELQYQMDERDRRKVRAQTWPKFAFVHSPKDRVVRIEKEHSFDEAPPKPPYPQSIVEDMAVIETNVESRISRNEADGVLRTSDKSYIVTAHEQWNNIDGALNADMLASHRLSLQELIKIHENEIAKQAKSAMATAHAQIYLKRPPNECKAKNVQSPPMSPREGSWDRKWDGAPQNNPNQFGIVNRDNRKPVVAQYEVTDLKPVDKGPIKVIEVIEKGSTTSVNSEMRERLPVKAKRHRTIGVVGFRQQIDRVSEEKAENKPKRHTAIGIVSVKAVATPERQLVKEETVIVSHAGYGLNMAAENELDGLDSGHRENAELPIQDSRQATGNKRIRKQKEYDFHAERAKRTEMQDEDALDEVFQCDEGTMQVVRSSQGVVQVRPDSDHNRERKTARSDEIAKGEGLTRIVVASPDKPSQPVEPVSTQPSNLHFHKPDVRTWNVPGSSQAYNYPKPYTISKAVPVAQVSPVSPALEQTSRANLNKDNLPEPSPLSRSQSAREMYETRLALWNLYPPDTSPEIHSTETSGNTTSQEKIIAETEPILLGSEKVLHAPEQTSIRENEPRGVVRQDKEEYYLSLIEKLKNENKDLISKHEAEKRELRQKYEEQRKVANAYQKLEDRYRRRVHELQEALSGCTCQSPFVNQNHVNVSQSLSNR